MRRFPTSLSTFISTFISTFSALVLGCALVCGSDTRAQTLYVLTDGAGLTTPQIHEIRPNCGPSLNSCSLPQATLRVVPIPVSRGGIAYHQGSVYVTDGFNLGQTNPNCRFHPGCAFVNYGPIFDLSVDDTPGAVRLLATDGKTIATLTLGCPTGQVQSRCAVPGMPQIAALDWDKQTGNVWVSDPTGTIAEVQRTPTGCRVLRSFKARTPLGVPPLFAPVQSLAVDPCGQRIFVADAGARIISVSIRTAGSLGVCRVSNLPSGNFIVGLARRPAQAVVLGRGCSGPNCPNCVPVATTNDPTVPNQSFRVDVTGVPMQTGAPSTAILLGSFTQGQVQPPGFCAPVRLGGALFMITSTVVRASLSGRAPCHGNAFVVLPIPNNPQLCGLTVYMQWGVGCRAGGISLSNGLAVTLN